MTGNIIGVIGQRLVRKLCPHCKKSKQPHEIEQELLGVTKSDLQVIYEPVGCEHCDGIGYKGRVAIIEVLRFSEELDELVAEKVTIGKIRQRLKQEGYMTMADDAVRRVLEGVTTLDEVSRVINLTDRLES